MDAAAARRRATAVQAADRLVGERGVGLAVEPEHLLRARLDPGLPGGRPALDADDPRRVGAELLQQVDERARRRGRRRPRRRAARPRPCARALRSTLPAPPSATDSRCTCTTGTGASGLTRSTSPQRYSSSIDVADDEHAHALEGLDQALEAAHVEPRGPRGAHRASPARRARASPARAGPRRSGVRSQSRSSRRPSASATRGS